MYALTCVCSGCAENNTHCTVTKPFVLVTKESGKFICIQRGLLMPHMCFSRMINISLAEKPREKRRVVCVYIKRSVSLTVVVAAAAGTAAAPVAAICSNENLYINSLLNQVSTYVSKGKVFQAFLDNFHIQCIKAAHFNSLRY